MISLRPTRERVGFRSLRAINARYPADWVNAALIALVAWVAALVVLYLLAAFDVTQFEAVGVPGI